MFILKYSRAILRCFPSLYTSTAVLWTSSRSFCNLNLLGFFFLTVWRTFWPLPAAGGGKHGDEVVVSALLWSAQQDTRSFCVYVCT